MGKTSWSASRKSSKNVWKIEKLKHLKNDIWKITTGQGDHYTSGCSSDYSYFKEQS